MKPTIEYRPKAGRAQKSKVSPAKASGMGCAKAPTTVMVSAELQEPVERVDPGSPEQHPEPRPNQGRAPTQAELDAFLEGFKARERAKVLARVHKHRAKKSREGGAG